jgi:mono/diheme cytochrome c family protein
MKMRLWFGAIVVGAGLALVPAMVQAQVNDIGKREYTNSCAICHGASGKGDGPLAAQLKTPVANLTKLEANNNGILPVEKIYAVIDGRQDVAVHGSREMPLWGNVFRTDVAAGLCFGLASPKELEDLVKGRIFALIGYIHTLQVK